MTVTKVDSVIFLCLDFAFKICFALIGITYYVGNTWASSISLSSSGVIFASMLLTFYPTNAAALRRTFFLKLGLGLFVTINIIYSILEGVSPIKISDIDLWLLLAVVISVPYDIHKIRRLGPKSRGQTEVPPV
ncbi:MAG: hypothetical protein GY829_01695 [Gammaproteobacteria bacterium]|nr:hypothetical protein [Gammaproteobacteria bacterium]